MTKERLYPVAGLRKCCTSTEALAVGTRLAAEHEQGARVCSVGTDDGCDIDVAPFAGRCTSICHVVRSSS